MLFGLKFEKRLGVGEMVVLCTLLVSGVGAYVLDQERQTVLTEDVGELKQDVADKVTDLSEDLSQVRKSVDSARRQLGSEISVIDDKVDEVIAVQSTSTLRFEQLEEDRDEFDARLGEVRGIAITARSNIARDQAVQAERHEMLMALIKEMKASIEDMRRSDDRRRPN